MNNSNKKRGAYIGILLACSLLVSACSGFPRENKSSEFPECYAFLQQVYGSNIRENENGDFIVVMDGEEKTVRREDFEISDSKCMSLKYMGTSRRPGLGYTARYLFSGKVSLKDDIVNKKPLLQTWLDGYWWTLETGKFPGSELGIWFEKEPRLFGWNISRECERWHFISMMGKGGEAMPSGKYRIVLSFGEGELRKTAKEGLSIAAEFEHTVNESNMIDKYPETWKILRETFGDYIQINDEGNFCTNYMYSDNLPSRAEILAETDTGEQPETFTLEWIENKQKDEEVYPQMRITNNTDGDIEINPYSWGDLQFFSEGQWWHMPNYFGVGRHAYIPPAIRAGDSFDFCCEMTAFNTKLPFPPGKYRYLVGYDSSGKIWHSLTWPKWPEYAVAEWEWNCE